MAHTLKVRLFSNEVFKTTTEVKTLNLILRFISTGCMSFAELFMTTLIVMECGLLIDISELKNSKGLGPLALRKLPQQEWALV